MPCDWSIAFFSLFMLIEKTDFAIIKKDFIPLTEIAMAASWTQRICYFSEKKRKYDAVRIYLIFQRLFISCIKR